MASDMSYPLKDYLVFSDPVDFSRPLNYTNLKGKTVLITGGASGIGAECSRILATHGANVIVGDINQKAGVELIAELRQHSGNTNHHYLPLDVTSWTSQTEYFKQAAKLSPHGGIDCVIANAGIADARESAVFEAPPDYATMDNPPVPAMRTVDINLEGVLYTSTLALSYLSRNPGSQKCSPSLSVHSRDRHLILVSSIAGLKPIASQSLYCVAKHGVVGLFRSLRFTAPMTQGVRINMLNPYFVQTPILGSVGALALAGGRMAKIEDVVDATLRLISDQSIIGRGLIIGPQATASQIREAGLGEPLAGTNNGAIWDVYGDDFIQTELFTGRVIKLINLIAGVRGTWGVIYDIGTWLVFTMQQCFRRRKS